MFVAYILENTRPILATISEIVFGNMRKASTPKVVFIALKNIPSAISNLLQADC